MNQKHSVKMVRWGGGYFLSDLLRYAKSQGRTVNRRGVVKYSITEGFRRCVSAVRAAGGVAEVLRLVEHRNSQ